jgi:hypothetical protein
MTNKKKKESAEPEKDDLTKYFNNKEYATLIVGNDKEKKEKSDQNLSITELLQSREPGMKTEALKMLKSNDGKGILLASLASAKGNSDKKVLLAACWESGIDFSDDIDFFTTLLSIEKNTEVLLEVVTVIEENLPQCSIEAIKKLHNNIPLIKTENNLVLTELLHNLKKSCENLM